MRDEYREEEMARRAAELGQEAARLGFPEETCPYGWGTYLHDCWHDGYRATQQEEKTSVARDVE